MTIDQSFIEKIERMSKVEEVEVGGIKYFTKNLSKITPPAAVAMKAHTLTAIKDYFASMSAEMKSCVVHVVSPKEVLVRSCLDRLHRDREGYLSTSCIYTPFEFDQFVSVERFNIAIQAQFIQDETTANIIKVTGNVTSEAQQKTLDDGVSQTVTARSGIATLKEIAVPNPVALRPYRTFAEVDQPASEFIFRMQIERGGLPTCALFEADGGAWKLEAINNIKQWLVENLPEGSNIIA